MSIKAVIDTNVLVSAFWTSREDAPPARILRALLVGTVSAVINEEILSEYREVLHRPKFAFDARDVDAVITFIAQDGDASLPMDTFGDFPDPDDKVFYCTALAAQAHLITGNVKHYPNSAFVVTPAQFCALAGI